MSHTGIRLRISCPAGVLLDADSDMLHATARLGALAEGRRCMPGCDRHGWRCLVPGPPDMAFLGAGDLVVEVLPVLLPDPCADEDPDSGPDSGPDGGGDGAGEPCGCACARCSGCSGQL